MEKGFYLNESFLEDANYIELLIFAKNNHLNRIRLIHSKNDAGAAVGRNAAAKRSLSRKDSREIC